jgi:excisionase family DNA binding protein
MPKRDVPPPAPGYLNVREVAAHLRIKERKVYDLVSRGAIPHTRAGGKLLFAVEAVERWLSGRAVGAAGARPAPATIAGSHDPLLEWAVRESRCSLALLTQGSLDGVERLLAGEACAALVHLPSKDLSDFNRELAEERLRGRGIVLLEWAKRSSGLLVRNGNPKRLKKVPDLARRGVTVALRPAAAGSRVLLERLLAADGLAIKSLRLSPGEATTESDLALAIQHGEADAGLGAQSAAGLFGLDFVPVLTERLDLAVLRSAYFEAPLQRLFAFARGKRFRDQASALTGYDVAGLGSVSWNDPA